MCDGKERTVPFLYHTSTHYLNTYTCYQKTAKPSKTSSYTAWAWIVPQDPARKIRARALFLLIIITNDKLLNKSFIIIEWHIIEI